jgi:hypothetical protein
MATVLEYTIDEQCSVVHFLWAKGLNAKDILTEMFAVYGGKYMSLKVVHNWVQNFSEGHSKVADDTRQSAEVIQAAVYKDFYAAGLDALV